MREFGEQLVNYIAGPPKEQFVEHRCFKIDSSGFLDLPLYSIDFLDHDTSGMAQLVARGTGKPGIEDVFLANEALTAAYSGRLGKTRELSRRAEASAERVGEKEGAAGYVASAALIEALFGNAAQARQQAATALSLSTARDTLYAVALTLGFAGDAARAQVLADDLAKRFPKTRWRGSITCPRSGVNLH